MRSLVLFSLIIFIIICNAEEAKKGEKKPKDGNKKKKADPTPPSVPKLFNFCDLESCKCKRHIDCDNHDAKMSISCPEGTKKSDMAEFFQRILTKHNKYRNLLAGGGISHLSPAKRMASIIWNPTLAKMAEKNVLTCKFQRDECRNTPKYHFVGQNTGYYNYHKSMNYQPLNMILSIIDFWWNEHNGCSHDQLLAYPKHMDKKSKVIHHFTQMANQKVQEIGCAWIKISSGNMDNFRLVCNYCHGNIVSMHVYEPGPPTSGCKKGTHKIYPNLCSESEEYAPNPANSKMADD